MSCIVKPSFAELPAGSSYWINPQVDRVFAGYKQGDFLVGAFSGNKKPANSYEKVERFCRNLQVIQKGGVEVRESPSLKGRVITSYQKDKCFSVEGTTTNADGSWVVERVHVGQQSNYKVFWAFVRQEEQSLKEFTAKSIIHSCPCCGE